MYKLKILSSHLCQTNSSQIIVLLVKYLLPRERTRLCASNQTDTKNTSIIFKYLDEEVEFNGAKNEGQNLKFQFELHNFCQN